MTRKSIKRHRLTWRNIDLQVAEEENYFSDGQSHLEIHVIRPKKAPIPITSTGYRSHFIEKQLLTLAGGAVAFVRRWLDEEAASKDWQKAELKARQLTLFD